MRLAETSLRLFRQWVALGPGGESPCDVYEKTARSNLDRAVLFSRPHNFFTLLGSEEASASFNYSAPHPLSGAAQVTFGAQQVGRGQQTFTGTCLHTTRGTHRVTV